MIFDVAVVVVVFVVVVVVGGGVVVGVLVSSHIEGSKGSRRKMK